VHFASIVISSVFFTFIFVCVVLGIKLTQGILLVPREPLQGWLVFFFNERFEDTEKNTHKL
jgi:hypothetical protein